VRKDVIKTTFIALALLAALLGDFLPLGLLKRFLLSEVRFPLLGIQTQPRGTS
jgi:hypothetical protein